MSSWAESWGTAWGNSWGALVPDPTPEEKAGGGGLPAEAYVYVPRVEWYQTTMGVALLAAGADLSGAGRGGEA